MCRQNDAAAAAAGDNDREERLCARGKVRKARFV